METKDKRMITEHLVNKVFLPQVSLALHSFLTEYDKMIRYKIEYAKITGYDIDIQKTIILNIEQPTRNLIENLIAGLEEK